MEPPQLQVNTFVKNKTKLGLLDTISKFFVVSQNVCGLNRAAIIDFMKPKLLGLAFIYAVALNTVIMYLIGFIPLPDVILDVVLFSKISQHLINCFLSFIFWKRLRHFYEVIDKFDRELKTTPKVSSEQTAILLQLIGLFTVTTALFISYHRLLFLPFHLNYYLELHFYGYLTSLLFLRLRLINDYVESPVAPNAILSKVVEKHQKPLKSLQISMNKLMDYYQTIVSAFEVLNDAIKWQFIAILATTFLFLLAQSLKLAIMFKSKEEFRWDIMPWTSIPLMDLLSFLTPCVCCDLLRAQVHRLRELVASKLYENQLDKVERSNARALLALTETSNLSFSLLRVVDVSISLPFTLLGLLATYLIILLNFRRLLI